MKSLHRIFLSPIPPQGETFTLDPENGRILTQVLRAQAKDQFILIDGKGNSAQAEVLGVERKACRVRVLSRNSEPGFRPKLTLLQGYPKGEKPEWIVQKAVELGVERLIFLEAGHSVPKTTKNLEPRFQKVAIEALRQSRNPFLPEISGPTPLGEAVRDVSPTLRIMLDEAETLQSLRTVLPASCPDSIVMAVGPEGGWSAEDRQVLGKAKFMPITVGPTILRTETAAVVALGLCRAWYAGKP